jgi:hypothetical protein
MDEILRRCAPQDDVKSGFLRRARICGGASR